MSEGEYQMLDQAQSTHRRADMRMAKRVAAWVGLGLVALLVWSWYGQYREGQVAWDAAQNKPKPSEVASAAAAAAAKGAAKPPTKAASGGQASKVVIVSDVTFRKDDNTSSEPIRGLKTGEQLTLVGQVGGWLKVSDSSGVTGWVSASPKFTKIVGK